MGGCSNGIEQSTGVSLHFSGRREVPTYLLPIFLAVSPLVPARALAHKHKWCHTTLLFFFCYSWFHGRLAPSRSFLCANRVISIDRLQEGNIKSRAESICLCVLAREALAKARNERLVSLASEDLPNYRNRYSSVFTLLYCQILQHIYVQSAGTYIWETDPIFCLLESHIN